MDVHTLTAADTPSQISPGLQRYITVTTGPPCKLDKKNTYECEMGRPAGKSPLLIVFFTRPFVFSDRCERSPAAATRSLETTCIPAADVIKRTERVTRVGDSAHSVIHRRGCQQGYDSARSFDALHICHAEVQTTAIRDAVHCRSRGTTFAQPIPMPHGHRAVHHTCGTVAAKHVRCISASQHTCTSDARFPSSAVQVMTHICHALPVPIAPRSTALHCRVSKCHTRLGVVAWRWAAQKTRINIPVVEHTSIKDS